MQVSRAIEILTRQRDAIPRLKGLPSDNQEFTKWKHDTEVAIQRIFGETSRHYNDFSDISYSLMVFTTSTPDYEFERAYVRGNG